MTVDTVAITSSSRSSMCAGGQEMPGDDETQHAARTRVKWEEEQKQYACCRALGLTTCDKWLLACCPCCSCGTHAIKGCCCLVHGCTTSNPSDAGWQSCYKHHCNTAHDSPAAAAAAAVQRWRKPRQEPWKVERRAREEGQAGLWAQHQARSTTAGLQSCLLLWDHASRTVLHKLAVRRPR
jgi:hypothetical protein